MTNDPQWMIYGAYGFTGELIARRASEAGLRPVLAGRDATRVEALAKELSLPHRAFSLDSPPGVEAGLAGMQVVLHCAGPYSKTSRPMVDGCLRAKAHYLDLTGELAVIEAVLDRDEEARRAGIVLMPSVGFDVVPTDCMAVKLKDELTDATELELGISAGLKPSPGTAKTVIEALDFTVMARRDGELRPLSTPRTEQVHFGGKQRSMMSTTLGDLATAYRSTGIRNITVYLEAPPAFRYVTRAMRLAAPLLMLGPVQRFLKRQAGKRATGPSAEDRKTQRMWIWGRVTNASGASVSGALDVPEGYEFTVLAALECVRRVLGGQAEPGATTPAAAFGASLVTELAGVGAFETTRRA